jgi:hypothetical protein
MPKAAKKKDMEGKGSAKDIWKKNLELTIFQILM